MSIETPRQVEKTDVGTPTATEAAQAVFPDSKNREGFTKRQKIIGSILAVVGLAGGAVAANHFSSNTEAPVTKDQENPGGDILPTTIATPDASPSVSPSNITPLETATPVPGENLSSDAERIKSLQIKSNQSSEALAKNYLDLFSQWNMAGADDATRKTYLEDGLNGKNRLDNLSKESAEESAIFAEAIYGPDWSSDPEISTTVNIQSTMHVRNLEIYAMTSSSAEYPSQNPINKEAFKAWDEFESVQEVTPLQGSRRMLITYISRTNEDKNNAGAIFAQAGGDATHNGARRAVMVEFKTVDGHDVVIDNKFGND